MRCVVLLGPTNLQIYPISPPLLPISAYSSEKSLVDHAQSFNNQIRSFIEFCRQHSVMAYFVPLLTIDFLRRLSRLAYQLP